MKLKDKCTIEYLKECFRYDELEGVLYWQDSRPPHHFKDAKSCKIWNTRYAGHKAGGIAKIRETNIYLLVKVNNIKTPVHQVIWAIYYNEFADMIDHIDGDGLNNKLTNIRKSNPLENGRNHKLYTTTKSGITGVRWERNRWRVSIGDGKHYQYLGTYDNFFDACCARISAANKLGYGTRNRFNE